MGMRQEHFTISQIAKSFWTWGEGEGHLSEHHRYKGPTKQHYFFQFNVFTNHSVGGIMCRIRVVW